jgi:hypothetical protein
MPRRYSAYNRDFSTEAATEAATEAGKFFPGSALCQMTRAGDGSCSNEAFPSKLNF